jgi:hypothetical protein
MENPKPSQVSLALRRVASYIDQHESPSPTKVAYSLNEILSKMGFNIEVAVGEEEEPKSSLTPEELELAHEAGYEAASLHWSKNEPPREEMDIFLWTMGNDKRIPMITETDPNFEDWLKAVGEGSRDFYESVGAFKDNFDIEGGIRNRGKKGGGEGTSSGLPGGECGPSTLDEAPAHNEQTFDATDPVANQFL